MLKRIFVLFVGSVLLMTMLPVTPTLAQTKSVSCTDGTGFDNGVEITVVQMRSGFTYTATAIGLNGFDPVLAVLRADGKGLCTDDDFVAAGYSVNLPTTGFVNPSTTSAQVRFNQDSQSAFADVSLVVGGLGNTAGEFVLILEGMAVTAADDIGDPFSITVDDDMINSGIPLTAYMISTSTTLNPVIDGYDDNQNFLTDADGYDIWCDDGGGSDCWGESYDLSNSYVSTLSGKLAGGPRDSMLSIPLDTTLSGFHFNLMMTSYGTLGQYVLAFHMGTSEPGSGSKANADTNTDQQNNNQNTQSGNVTGFSFRCNDGSSFDNGVVVTVNQMRSGFTYTATAIGLNGFDPVLAVVDSSGSGPCVDDSRDASFYDVDLPSSGYVPTSDTSAQVFFNQDSQSAFADISLVVGGLGNTSGEFVLILEGMAVTAADNQGDMFSILVNESMLSSGVPLSVYMISRTDDLDPFMYLVDSNYDPFFDDVGNIIGCDDAGDSSSCWGTSRDLSENYFVTVENGLLPGGRRDSMLFFPLATSLNGLSIDVMMTSYQKRTLGQYMMVIHAGTSSTPLEHPNSGLKPNV